MCVYCVKCTKFGKLFLRKVIKTVATRCLDFSSKHPKMHLAAGLRPDPLGELKRSPRPPSRKREPNSKGRGREGREGMRGRGGKREGEGRGGILPDQSKYGCYGPEGKEVPAPPFIEIQRSHNSNLIKSDQGPKPPVWKPKADVQFPHL